MTEVILKNNRTKGTKFRHLWNLGVGAGRACEGLRNAWQEQLKIAVNDCGFKYLRFHGLFHDDMFIYREIDGKAVYNFQYIDELFDKLLEIGIRPFVEFGFCPKDLASVQETVFWWKGHGSPPEDLNRWAELIEKTVRHWIDRYGIEEVVNWYFEVWNEPNLKPFFTGTKSQYFELYKVTATKLKEIDENLRVGGPATSNFVPDARFEGETEDIAQHRVVLKAEDLNALDWKPVWVERFLDFCEQNNLPVDFVSCHPYPTDWALDEHGQGLKSTRNVSATPDDLKRLKKIVGESSFPNAEIHLTEWNSSSSPRDFTHDYLQAATFVVKTNLESVNTVDSLMYWTFTDVFEESGAGETIFHGGFGMINYQSIVKPTFHAYRFLNSLGDEILEQNATGIITRNSVNEKVSAIVFHYPPEMPLSVPASFVSREVAENTLALGKNEPLGIELNGLSPKAEILVETLDKSHGNAMKIWAELGNPESPNREQIRILQARAKETKKETFTADENGGFVLNREIEPWSVILIKET